LALPKTTFRKLIIKGFNVRKLAGKPLILTLLATLLVAVSFAQTANFTATTVSGCSPLVVDFQDQSTGANSWFWDFGNGATSTLKNPSTTYFNTGSYTVKLTVTNGQSSNTITRTNYITVWGKPGVNFTVNDSTACFPHRAQFTNASTAAAGTTNSSYIWDFGNGSQSTQQNPGTVYTTSGNYAVTLKVTNDKGCFAVLTKPAYIKIAGGVVADFTHTLPTTCRTPVNISFTNNSSGPGTLTYAWDFGDGGRATTQNPTHTYTTPGNYTVSMAITSSNGCSDTLKKTGAIKIDNINTKITAPDSICVKAPVSFVNSSTPTPASSNWSFGDATTSTQLSPVKVYNTPGTYTVQLINTYSYCSDTAKKTLKVLPRPVANYTAGSTRKCEPNLTVNFTDLSTNAVSWKWDFGDGNTSTQKNPSNTYTGYGDFDVRLVVTNSSGCTDTLNRTSFVRIKRPQITVPSLPVRGCIPYTINPVATILSIDAVTSYLWDFGNGATSTSPTPSYTYTTQGTYHVKLTITTSTGCTETLFITDAVKVGRKPNVNFSAVPTPVCAFKPVQFTDLTNEADEWLWFFGDGGSSGSQNPLYEYSDTGTFTVLLYATNNGCRDSFKINRYITVKPPIAKFGFIPDCNNRLQFAFKDSSIGATDWLWEFGDGNTSTEQNPVHTYSTYSAYSVKLTVTNGSCTHSITKPVNVFNDRPDFTVSEDTICRPGTIFFTGLVSNPGNIVNYAWDFGDSTPIWNSIDVGSGPAAYHYYPFSGKYTIRMTITDIYGCSTTVSKPDYIVVNGPTASINSINSNGCIGLTTTFNDLSQSDGRNNIVSWTWNFGDGTTLTNTTNASVQHTYPVAGSYTVSLRVRDAIGCVDSLVLPNYVNTSDPKADFSTEDTLTCPGSNVQFTNNSTSLYLTIWDFGDGNTSSVNNPSHPYADTGHYSVKLTITDLNGCSDTLFKPFYVTVDRPIASFTMSDSVSSCTPFEVQFTNTSHYAPYQLWDLATGSSSAPNPVQYYVNPGNYPIKLIIMSRGGCYDTAYGNVRVYDTTGTYLRYAPLNGCKPLGVDLNAFSPAPMSFTWDYGDGVIENNTTINVKHVYNFFGEFVPKVIMTDPSGCVIPVTGADTIRIIGATVNFGWDKKLFCDSGLVNFTDSTTYNDSVVLYTWDFGDGNTTNIRNPNHRYDAPGLYTVMLNVRTISGCVDTMRVPQVIKVSQSPMITVAGDSVICVNDFMKHLGVFQRTDTSAIQWSWQFPNGNRSTLQNPLNQQYTSAGSFMVQTVATNSSGCADTATKNIRVNPLPAVTLPSTLTMQAGYPVQIPATYTSNVMNWTWTPSTTLSCADCPEPTASPKFNTKYNVSFVDSNGCRNTGEVQVIVICKNSNVFVPNTFSPNGDGSNDVFYVRGRGLERVKSIRVFNRWGEVVFEQNNFPVNNAAFGWDGKYKGNKPQPDVYVYQVEVFCENSEVIRFEGNIALIQ
jgi:gliding motility-associated-like protein